MSGQHDDVLVVIDAASLLVEHLDVSLDPDAPTSIDRRHVYVLNAGYAQQISCNDSRIVSGSTAGDELHIRESALSFRGEESVLFYRITLKDANVVAPMETITRDAVVSTPNPNDLLYPKTQRVKEHFYRSEVKAAGSVGCMIDFIVLGNGERTLGYFRWETYIDIQDGGQINRKRPVIPS